MKKTNSLYGIEDYKKKIVADLQNFLIYKTTTSIDFGSRLLEPFEVVDVSINDKENSILAQFADYKTKSGEHYWVDKKEFNDFVKGEKKSGITLNIDRHYIDNGHVIFELRLSHNGIKNKTVYEVSKFKNLFIKYNNGFLYKVFDVQVKLDVGMYVENVIKLFVTEIDSAEQFINKQVVFKDNMTATSGPGMSIVLSGPNTQEEYVKKADAIKGLELERTNTLSEIRQWLQTIVIKKSTVDTVELRDEFTKKFK